MILIVVAAFIVWLGLLALWITAIHSAVTCPHSAYAEVGRSPGATIALVIITGWLGAAYYWLVIRRELRPYIDPPPADDPQPSS